MFFKIDVLKNFAIFTGKHLCWSLFKIKLQAWRQETAKKVFSCEYYKSLPEDTSQNISDSEDWRCSMKKIS